MMWKVLKKIFRYLENFWIGVDSRPSLRAGLAIAFSIHFINNMDFAIKKWGQERSLESLSVILGIEAGLILGLLGITAYNNIANKKIDSAGSTPLTNLPIQVETVEQINVKTE